MAVMKNEVNVPVTITIGVIGLLLVAVATVAVDGWYKSVEAETVTEKWDESPNTWLETIRDPQMADLRSERRINRQHYKVSIDDAMKIIAKNDGKLTE
jgi:hypothetical protein